MTGILQSLLGSVSSAVAVVTDAYFNLVTLLLPGNGTNGAQNNTFLDSSSNNFTITRNGNTTQGTFSPFSQTGWSNYFNGTNASLTYPNNTAFAFGTGAFTIEFWINGPSNDNTFILGGRSAIGTMHITTGGTSTGTTVSCLRYVGSSTITTSSTLITNNSWNHCAIVRDGSNNITLYVNGVSAGTGTDTTNYTTTSGTWYIAQNDSGSSNYLQGYISNLRILKGTALYTGSFTPPTAPLTAITNTSLLTCQSNRFIDNSSNAFAITINGTPSVQAFSPFAPTAAYSAATNGGSGYFDGTGDFLNFTGSSATNFNGTDWTIETWVYLNGAPTDFLNIIQSTTGANNWIPYLSVGFRSTYELNIALNAANNQSTQKAVPYAWNHIAVVRSGGVVKVYLNGAATSISVTVDINNSNLSFYFGKADNTPGGGSAFAFLNGYMCGTRFTKTAVYTAAFTPPTSPPTAITNTQLLLNFTNAGITDATAKNDLETVGNAQISTTQSKFGGSSMYFDGTGDRLYIPDGKGYVNGTEPFTLECWVYLGGTPNYWTIFGSSSGSGLLFTVQNLTTVIVNPSGAGNTLSGTTSLTAGTWFHLALTRNSSNRFDIWVNGVSVGNATSSQSFGTPTHFVIGAADNSGGQQFNGYLDDVRISKFCRYTTTFTPPTAAFPLS